MQYAFTLCTMNDSEKFGCFYCYTFDFHHYEKPESVIPNLIKLNIQFLRLFIFDKIFDIYFFYKIIIFDDYLRIFLDCQAIKKSASTNDRTPS
jgi:hypothetical protein